ncbi:Kiwa anti-phage protein KwaB-like domain-containing protein [Staphylococcus schweitzeri]|uniref:Kiwa anti-phage protein KwaB-like domain-containing protein n=1 Tax=Staphylococcus schweitzeri TaxID=1654388 RepID=UPI000503759B|nr:Kiwa anti-phage protein KwaB-like domain-containing protein [Staphylococcus schweitzeri]CDR61304.1 hypothetical protein ERS140239_01125 [Staphylococcus schweitzeri]
MAINEISNIIQNGLLNIYCGEKKSTNEDKYYLLRLSIKDNNNGSDLIQDLKKEHQLNARNLLNYDIQEYNPIISQNDVVERISTSDTNGYNELMSKLTNIDTSNNIQTKRIKFYVFEYSLNDEKVYIIRRNFNNRSLKRSVFVKLDPEGIYDKLTLDDYLKMDYEIDLLIYGESIYIDNHVALERIFYINEEFKDKANIILNRIERTEKVKNFMTVKDKLLNNGRFVRRIAKLSSDNDRAILFIESIENTKLAIEQFSLPIIYNEKTGQFEVDYNDLSQLNVLVNLMQDAYYKTIIGGNRGEDPHR